MNSDLVNFQRFLADNDSIINSIENIFDMLIIIFFLGTCFDFFCCLQEILLISCNDQTSSWIFFQTIKISAFCIFKKYYYKMIIVKLIAKMFSCLFVLVCKCLVPNSPLHCWHPYQNKNHLMNSCLHLSIESWIPCYHNVKSNILWCFQNQQFA